MFIVIEGVDGSGKKTQTILLKNWADRNNIKAKVVSFPRYGKTSFSKTISDYLNGKFGTIDEVPPEFSSLLFAGDRFESKQYLINTIKSNELTIVDRYSYSNFAYHAARVKNDEVWDFISWLSNIEFKIFSIPKPDLIFFLDTPVNISNHLIYSKDPRSYTKMKADIHEMRKDYMFKCREIFHKLHKDNYLGNWIKINSTNPQNELLDSKTISLKIINYISKNINKNKSI